ncbi:MAG: FAD:protein FMN transferase [Verrucomicrobiae bacterium]|nr:FAD:protein FMN transferase [Verrucomicrobiae bacterium]
MARLLPAGLLILAALAVGCAPRRLPPQADALRERYEFTRPQMGVPFRIVLYATNQTHAQTAANAAFARVEALNAIFSDYESDSEITLLGRNAPVGQPVPVSPELAHLLHRAQSLARASDGAFDVTVGPIVQLWRRARRHRELPPPHLLAEARTRSGWQFLSVDPRSRTVTLHRERMRLDFGGIAKGYAADEALRVLRDLDCPRALVAAAGDVAAGDPPPDRPGWRVEIGQSDHPSAPSPRALWLRNAAVATSGDLFQRLEIDGHRYSHILDPRTGIGLTDRSLAIVLARDATTADSLATTLSVLGPDGLPLIERTPAAAALLLRSPDGSLEIFESRRLPRWLRNAPATPESP